VELSALRRTLDRLLSHADGGGGPIWPILEIPCEVAADK